MYLWLVRASVACHIADNLRQVLSVFDDVDVPQHLQIRELGRDTADL